MTTTGIMAGQEQPGAGDRGVLGGLLEQRLVQHAAECGRADYGGQHDRVDRYHEQDDAQPVTNQVTPAPDNGRRSATYSDTGIPLSCRNPI